MASAATGYEHVVVEEDGVPRIAGTTTKVVEIVTERLAYGWSPEEVQFQHPYLTLGQIYSALAYYWDHAAKLDQDIQRRLQQVEEYRRAAGPSPLAARLKAATQGNSR
jgi:uncharacterized protein (DUF433 family)